jgi:HK97 family phage prohead protease
MTTETRYINEIQQDSPIIFLEKATDGKVALEDISKALDEYERLYKAGFATPAELLTLSRAYPENDEYSKALEEMGVGDDDSLVIGGPASIELIDREGHLITTKALEPAFEKYMNNIRNRNVMVLHSDVQVGWALPAYISSEGSIFKSGVDDTGLFFIAELRNDTKISQKVRDQITSGQMKSYSIAGSALKTQTIEKGLLKVMQVDELELAEVTICEKGVNQEAGFDILKGDNVPTKSCADGSCLTKMQECECQNATPEVETKPIAHKPMQLLTKKDGKPDYFASLQKWINKGSVNGEDFDYSDAGLQEAIDYATGLMRDKKKVVFEWEDYKKGYNNMATKDSLLKLAVEVLKELPEGAVYADDNTPADAIRPNPSGRGRGHWFPEQYAAQKEKGEFGSRMTDEDYGIKESESTFEDYGIDINNTEDLGNEDIVSPLYTTTKGGKKVDMFITRVTNESVEPRYQGKYHIKDSNKMTYLYGYNFSSIGEAKIAISRVGKVGYHSMTNDERYMYNGLLGDTLARDTQEAKDLRAEALSQDRYKEWNYIIRAAMIEGVKNQEFRVKKEYYQYILGNLYGSAIDSSDRSGAEKEEARKHIYRAVTYTINKFLQDCFIDGDYEAELCHPKFDTGVTYDLEGRSTPKDISKITTVGRYERR